VYTLHMPLQAFTVQCFMIVGGNTRGGCMRFATLSFQDVVVTVLCLTAA